jgi:hypothetical protein
MPARSKRRRAGSGATSSPARRRDGSDARASRTRREPVRSGTGEKVTRDVRSDRTLADQRVSSGISALSWVLVVRPAVLAASIRSRTGVARHDPPVSTSRSRGTIGG